MPSPTLTRRALIAGAGTTVASAALAVPYVNAAHSQEVCSLPALAETITDRLDRLTNDLAQAMGEYQGGRFKVVVEPDGGVHFVRMHGDARVKAAIAELKTAAEAIDPTIKSWMIKLPSQADGHWCPLTVSAFRA